MLKVGAKVSQKMEDPAHHEVYVRSFNDIREYEEKDVRRYLVRHTELDEDELYWQENCERDGW